MSDDIEKQLEDIEALFVQTAREMTTDGDKVTFHGLSPATLFFSDRPQRVVGHLTTQQFVDEWGKGENSFAADPPNARDLVRRDRRRDARGRHRRAQGPADRRRLAHLHASTCSRAACLPRASSSRCSSTRSAGRSRRSRSRA